MLPRAILWWSPTLVFFSHFPKYFRYNIVKDWHQEILLAIVWWKRREEPHFLTMLGLRKRKTMVLNPLLSKYFSDNIRPLYHCHGLFFSFSSKPKPQVTSVAIKLVSSQTAELLRVSYYSKPYLAFYNFRPSEAIFWYFIFIFHCGLNFFRFDFF